MTEFLIADVSADEEPRGTLRAELARQALRARRFLLRAAARGGEVAPFLETIRVVTERRGLQLKLVLPPGMTEAIERGEWNLIRAKEGGFLPTLATSDGKFSKQVRLATGEARDAAALANAAAHAQTHAMLRQILEKLEVMDRKLDLLLAGQRDAWIGKIIAGTKMFTASLREPGDDGPLLAGALQSLEEGRNIGVRSLRTSMAARPKAPGLFEMERPSERRAKWLDDRQEDLTWIYGASRTIAAIHVAQDRPLAARKAMDELGAEVGAASEGWESVFEFAAYSREREAFWHERLPVLCAAHQPARVTLALSTTTDELLELGQADKEEK